MGALGDGAGRVFSCHAFLGLSQSLAAVSSGIIEHLGRGRQQGDRRQGQQMGRSLQDCRILSPDPYSDPC